MKRKEITETIAKVGAGTFALNGSMSLINPKTGEGFDVDMSATLAIVRGTLAWVDTLLEDGAKPASVDCERCKLDFAQRLWVLLAPLLEQVTPVRDL